MKPKILVVLGPTASGKSDLAVTLANKFNGEVISADSRQVYKGMDIGSGKITKKEMQGVKHHLLDVVSPRKIFSVSDYKTKADKAIQDILKRKKLPIICGGTGFYIQSVVDNMILPEVPPNPKLRKELATKSLPELFKILVELDFKRAQGVDVKNPVRLIRAIEIAKALGRVPEVEKQPQYDALQIGIQTSDEVLKDKIYQRFIKRLKIGMVEEARRLHKEGLTWKRMEQMGLEYKFLALYLQKKISKKEMIERLTFETRKYARRQKTWFRKDKRIEWFDLKDIKKIEKTISDFIGKK